MHKDPAVLLKIPETTSEELLRNTIDRYIDGYRSAIAIKEALDLGLFDRLIEWTELDVLSASMGLERNLLGYLCESLGYIGLLERDGLSFRNRRQTNDFLVSSSEMSQVKSIAYRMDQMSKMAMLDSALRGDRGSLKSDMFTDAWISMIGEGAIGGPIGMTIRCIESHIDLEKVDSWMDLGGGHGLYSIAMAHSHPNIRYSVFDQPSITPSTRRFSEEYGIELDIQTGDFYKDRVEGTYSIVFSSYNRSCSDPVLIPVIKSILKPGGYYIIRRPKGNRYWNPLFSLQRSIVSDFEFSPEEQGPDTFLDELEKAGLRRLFMDEVGNSEVIIYGNESGRQRTRQSV